MCIRDREQPGIPGGTHALLKIKSSRKVHMNFLMIENKSVDFPLTMRPQIMSFNLHRAFVQFNLSLGKPPSMCVASLGTLL